MINYKLYSLFSSRDNLERYIGYTKHTLSKRLKEHIKCSKNNKTYKDKWIQKELKDGFKINSIEIDNSFNFEEVNSKEIHYILLYKSFGAKLVNGTKGGGGVKGNKCSEEHKEWNRLTKSKKVYCFEFETSKLYKEFDSLKSMIDIMGFTKTMTRMVLMGKKRHHKGFTFSYDGLCPVKSDRKYRAWNKSISTIGLQKQRNKSITLTNDEEILTFTKVTDAIKFLSVSNNFFYKEIKNNTILNYKINY